MYKVDDYNRDQIIERYATDIVGGLHFLDCKEMLKNCLIDKKQQLDNEELEIEIMRHDPMLMTDIYIEEILQEI